MLQHFEMLINFRFFEEVIRTVLSAHAQLEFSLGCTPIIQSQSDGVH